jgi:hypothetical protein
MGGQLIYFSPASLPLTTKNFSGNFFPLPPV